MAGKTKTNKTDTPKTGPLTRLRNRALQGVESAALNVLNLTRNSRTSEDSLDESTLEGQDLINSTMSDKATDSSHGLNNTTTPDEDTSKTPIRMPPGALTYTPAPTSTVNSIRNVTESGLPPQSMPSAILPVDSTLDNTIEWDTGYDHIHGPL